MSISPNLPAAVAVIFNALLLSFVQAQTPEDVIFQIGTPDACSAEFLNKPDWKAFADKVPDKSQPVPFLHFTVGKDEDAVWTPWHWSTHEAKAGFRQFTAEIEFTASRDYNQNLYLIIGVCHGLEPSQVVVETNGTPSPVIRSVKFPRFENPWEQFARVGTYQNDVVVIPAGAVKKGVNVISVTLRDGSLIFYDYVCLREKPQPLDQKGVEPLLPQFRRAGMPEEILFVLRKPSYDAHWYANIGYYGDNVCRLPFPMNSGGAICIYNVETKQVRTIFSDPGGNIRDPQIHYDGKKVLFSYLPSGKKHYSLYEINIDGTGLKQITGVGEDAPLTLPEGVTPSTSAEHRTTAASRGSDRDFAPPGWDDYEPTYLPDDSIIFCSTRAKRWVNCWLVQVGTIHKCNADGSNIRPLSCNVEQDNTPWVLPNGQVIYMRWEYVDREQVTYHHLWTMNPDGTRQMVYYGNQRPYITMLAPKPIPGTDKVVCIFSPGHGRREHYGPITIVDPRLGPDSPLGAKTITPTNDFADPWAFSEDMFMAASYDKIVLVNGAGRAETIFTLPPDLFKGNEPADQSNQGYAADNRLPSTDLNQRSFWISEPRPIMPRQRERVIADQTDPNAQWGSLALANIYRGRKMKDVPPGTVTHLLIYETLPKPIHYSGGMEQMSTFGTFTLERLYGSVPVTPEGSAYFNLPPNRAFLFLAMDKDGHCVKRMHSFTSVMPGERTTCIGCHEERTETPNADDRDRLFRLMRSAPVNPEPVAGYPDIFSFPRDIQPILDKYCLECHNPDREEGGFNASGHWNPVYTFSYMQMSWRKMFGDNRNRPRSNFDPYEIGTGSSTLLKMIEEHHQGVNMDEKDVKMIRLWLDAGANYAGTYAANASGGLGYYMQNRNVRNDRDWPETKAMDEAITRRCDPCHCPTAKERQIGTYKLFTDYKVDHFPPHQNNMFVAHTLTEDGGRFIRHVIFDLSYPEQSKVLRGPLSKSAGGLGTCEAKSGKVVFKDTSDPDYQTILAGIERGRRYILEEDNRFSMWDPSPNNGKDCPKRFVPRWAYLREMIRYGLLPVDADPNASYNPYELDRLYFESQWYGGGK